MEGNILRCTEANSGSCRCAYGWAPVLAADATLCEYTGETTTALPTSSAPTATVARPQSAAVPAATIGVAAAMGALVLLAVVVVLLYFFCRRRRLRRKVRTLFVDQLMPAHIREKVRPSAVFLTPMVARRSTRHDTHTHGPPPEQADDMFQMQYDAMAPSSTQDAYRDLLISPARVELTSGLLGQGQFGVVWRGKLLPDRAHRADPPRDVAVKVLQVLASSRRDPVVQGDDGAVIDERRLIHLLLEARVHARMQHPHLVRLLAVQEEVQPVMLLMEYCEGGDLKNALRQAAAAGGDGDLSSRQRRDMATQVAAGLSHLHRHLCLHRDIAARNVLLTARGPAPRPPCGAYLKLADLGLSRILREEQDYYRVRVDMCLAFLRAR